MQMCLCYPGPCPCRKSIQQSAATAFCSLRALLERPTFESPGHSFTSRLTTATWLHLHNPLARSVYTPSSLKSRRASAVCHILWVWGRLHWPAATVSLQPTAHTSTSPTSFRGHYSGLYQSISVGLVADLLLTQRLDSVRYTEVFGRDNRPLQAP